MALISRKYFTRFPPLPITLSQSFMIPSSDLYLSYSILSSSPPSQSQLQVLYITLVSAILGRITSRIREVSGPYRVSHPKLCRDLNFSDLTCNTYLHTVSSVWEMHGDNSRTGVRMWSRNVTPMHSVLLVIWWLLLHGKLHWVGGEWRARKGERGEG